MTDMRIDEKIRMQYLGALQLLGEITPFLPRAHELHGSVVRAMRDAERVIPGLLCKRAFNRWDLMFDESETPEPDGAWKPLVQAENIRDETNVRMLLEHWKKLKPEVPENDLLKIINEVHSQEVWVNDRYQVHVRRGIEWIPDMPPLVWLSLRRQDREPIRDWQHVQWIKNQLVGPECEGAELYPAEERLVNTANQYHIYVISEPGIWFPFGFREGRVVDGTESVGNSKQRLLDQDTAA